MSLTRFHAKSRFFLFFLPFSLMVLAAAGGWYWHRQTARPATIPVTQSPVGAGANGPGVIPAPWDSDDDDNDDDGNDEGKADGQDAGDDDAGIQTIANEDHVVAQVANYDIHLRHRLDREAEGTYTYAESSYAMMDRTTHHEVGFADLFTEASLLQAVFAKITDPDGLLKDAAMAADMATLRKVKTVDEFNHVLSSLPELRLSFCMVKEGHCQGFTLDPANFGVVGYDDETHQAVVDLGYQVFGNRTDLVFPRWRLHLDVKPGWWPLLKAAADKSQGFFPASFDDLKVCDTCTPYEGDVEVSSNG